MNDSPASDVRADHSRWARLRRSARLRFWGIVLAAIVTPAAIYPGMLTGRELPTSAEASGQNDLYDVNLPLRAWGGAALAHGRIPLWYPGSDAGLAIAAIPEAVPYYPFSAGFYAILPQIPATAWSILFHFALAGVGAGLLARRVGCAYSGRLLVAVAVSGGLWLPNHMRQINLLESGAWVPWAWLYLDRLIASSRWRNAAGLGLSMGMLALAGHVQMLHHTIVMLGGWTILRLALRARLRRPRTLAVRAGLLLAAAAMALAIAAPHLIPTWELSRWTDRKQLIDVPAMPFYLTTLLDPLFFGDPATGVRPYDGFFNMCFWEQALYIGLAPMALIYGALNFGWFARRRRPMLAALSAFIGAGLVLVYGRNSFELNRWLLLIPLNGAFRFTQRYLWFVDLALVLLAGLGLSWIERHWSAMAHGWRRRCAGWLAPAALLLTVLDLARTVPILSPVGDPSAWMTRPPTLAALEKAGASSAHFGERLATYNFKNTVVRSAELRSGWRPDLRPESDLHWFFMHQHPSLWNWPTLWGHVGLIPGWTAHAITDQHAAGLLQRFDRPSQGDQGTKTVEEWAALSGMLGGRWIASSVRLDSPSLRPVEQMRSHFFDCYLYENRLWLGPAWISRGAAVCENDEAAMQYFAGHPVDPNRAIISKQAIKSPLWPVMNGEKAKTQTAPASGPDEMHVASPFPERVEVDCRLASPGLLVLSQNYHPRWEVSIDGAAPQATQRVNLTQTAVPLSAGNHRVVFRFSGTLERVCLSFFGLGTALAFGLLLGTARRRKA